MVRSLLLSGLLLSLIFFRAGAEAEQLQTGQEIPPITMLTATGNQFNVKAACRGQWTVIGYLRGVWCPYGNRQLKEFRLAQDRIMEAGGAILAIAPETPRVLLSKVVEFDLGFVLLADEVFDAARSFGLLEPISEEEATPFLRARAAMIPLGRGEGYLVPQASVWIVDPEGKIAAVWRRGRGAGFIEAGDLLKELLRLQAGRP